ncbi:MAG: hypothetical protein HYS62_01520 [Candidatus Aenigmarchaeota archaeon]|nr:hypothetical protein [Candidatus Aenigmarchaeota archaeon]
MLDRDVIKEEYGIDGDRIDRVKVAILHGIENFLYNAGHFSIFGVDRFGVKYRDVERFVDKGMGTKRIDGYMVDFEVNGSVVYSTDALDLVFAIEELSDERLIEPCRGRKMNMIGLTASGYFYLRRN